MSGFNFKEWFFTIDHKRAGLLYLFGSIAAFGLGGTAALLIRLEQYKPGMQIFQNADQYNQTLTFHGAAMILVFLIPGLTGFFANYFLPLMIGAKDVAFPRVNAFTVWLFWAAVILALISLVIPDGLDMMWTGYPPYAVKTTGNTAFYVFIVHLLGFSSLLGAANFLVTVIHMRAPGLGYMQLNVFVWATLAAFALQLLFIPVLASAVTLLLTDKYLGTHFYDPSQGGDVVMYQNLFWFYSHPAVYVILLPAVGLLFEIISTMGQNRVFNYKTLIYGGFGGMVAIGGIVWSHHMYVAGTPNWLRIVHMFFTLLISVPVGFMTLSLTGTLYKSAIRYNVAMLYACSALFLLLVGGLTGIPLAIPAMDFNLNQTSFVHAHFHFVMALLSTFAFMGAMHFYFPKMSGRFADNIVSKLGWFLNFIGVNVTFWPLFIIGAQGMPRRYWDYEMFPQFEPYHHVATYGAIMISFGMTLTILNWIYCAFAGQKAPENPWNSASIEWVHAPSPPGPGNFPHEFTISPEWSPYEYGQK